MLENYLNADASLFFRRLSERDQKWAWLVIQEIRRRFPQADHWTTGGGDNIAIRIGVKGPTRERGLPKLYLSYWSSTLYCSLHKDFQDRDGLRIATTPERTPDLHQFQLWFEEVVKLLDDAGIQLIGRGLSPMDYIDQANGAMSDAMSDKYEIALTKLSPSLNQILFGPPGTGKTYHSINKALAILDPACLAQYGDESDESRTALKARFDELVKEGRIDFVTFHQSFSYEDFVEGIRAETREDGVLEYRVEPGVLKRLCDRARASSTPVTYGVRSKPRIWKISLDGTGPTGTKTYCLKHGEARIGWGYLGDLRVLDEQGNSDYQELGTNDRSSLSSFFQEMVVGDLLVCIRSVEQIEAIGVVTGDYRFEAPEQIPKNVRDDYNHVRPVNWIYQDVGLSILPLNDDTRFTLKTIYPMDRFSWGDLLAYLQENDKQPVGINQQQQSKEPHVLIIDEINRGNVSRIFGELITLIEPSKRAGASEALSTILPYSKRPFSVPDNLYLIGTMNTADRSLAGLDIALRRRFVFEEMPPRPDLLEEVVIDDGEMSVNVGELLAVLNQRIEVLLDRDHGLGHAYFMPLKAKPELPLLAGIFRNQILPLLQEYFFEDWQRIAWVLNDHRKVSKEVMFLHAPELDVHALFGDVPVGAQSQRWVLNEKAFDRTESYILTIEGDKESS